METVAQLLRAPRAGILRRARILLRSFLLIGSAAMM
jgi:hypothetical protein